MNTLYLRLARPIAVLSTSMLLLASVCLAEDDTGQPGGVQRFDIVASGAEVGFEGSSTLHDFVGKSGAVSGWLAFDPAHPGLHPRAHIEVEAATLDTDSKGRDKQMRKRLNTAEHPKIVFDLLGFTPESGNSSTDKIQGTATGTMQIHGISQTLSMPVTLERSGEGEFLLEGRAPLLMTDYEIKPPRVMGFIKVKPEVTIFIKLPARAQTVPR